VTAPERVDCVVVGAGLAGVTAAHALHAAGRRVVVLEARDRVGGRTSSTRTRDGTVDLGASWSWPQEPLVQALAVDLSVATFAQSLDGDALFEPDARGVRRLDGNPVDVPSARFRTALRSWPSACPRACHRGRCGSAGA
jgi:monoamine oxidase